MYLSFLFKYGGLAGKLPTDRGENLKNVPVLPPRTERQKQRHELC